MKKRINRHHAVTFFFLIFLFAVLTGTILRGYSREREKYTGIYAGYLDGQGSLSARIKASLLTAYESLDDIDSVIFGKNSFINAFGLTQRVIGNRFIQDAGKTFAVVKLNNGQLSLVEEKDSGNVRKAADDTAGLKAFLDKTGIGLLYVQLPAKIDARDKQLPAGVFDYANENADALCAALRSKGIAVMDIREEIVREGLSHETLFFRTDHHWKPQTGLWASGRICGKLNEDFGFDIDTALLNPDSFESREFENCFLGSLGKRVGRYYAGTENFTVLLPKYDTAMRGQLYNSNGSIEIVEGDFEDAMIDYSKIEPADYFGGSFYACYGGGDLPLSVYSNKNIREKEILLIRDSFSCVLTPFLSLAACAQIHSLDPRDYDHSITDYIRNINPDLVIVAVTPAYIEPEFFHFMSKEATD